MISVKQTLKYEFLQICNDAKKYPNRSIESSISTFLKNLGVQQISLQEENEKSCNLTYSHVSPFSKNIEKNFEKNSKKFIFRLEPVNLFEAKQTILNKNKKTSWGDSK